MDLGTLKAAILEGRYRSCSLCYWKEGPQCLRGRAGGRGGGRTHTEVEQRPDGVRARPEGQELSARLLWLIHWEFVYVIWAAQNQLHESKCPALCT